MKTKRILPLLAAVLAFSLGSGTELRGAALTWTANATSGTEVDGTGTWNTSNTNWLGAGSTNTSWVNGSDAWIGNTVNNGPANTLTLGANISAGNIWFNNAPSGAITIQNATGNSFTLTVTGSMGAGDGNGSTIAANVSTIFSNGLTYGGVTVGGHSETGGSQLTINGTSSITGSISVSNGTLKLAGSSTGATSINVTGGTLTLAGSSTVSGPVTVSGGTLNLSTAGFIANGWTSINDTNGVVQLSGNSLPSFSGTFGLSGGSLRESGTFTGALGTGAGQIGITNGALSGNGPGASSGVFNFNVGGVGGGTMVWGSAYFNPTTTFNFGVTGPNGNTTLVNGIDLAVASGTTTRTISLGGNGLANQTLAGNIINSGGGVANLTLNWANGNTGANNLTTLILSGSDNYNGLTTFGGNGNGGRFQLGVGGTGTYLNSTSGISLGSTAQFEVNVSGTTTIAAPISGNPTTSGYGTQYFPNTTLLIDGTGASAGTVVLTGSNTYGGGTTIVNGVLQIGNGGATGTLSTATTVTGSSGAVLAFDTSGAAVINDSLSGAMGLSQIGSGMVTLTGSASSSNFTYTGATTISGGTLQIGGGTSTTDAVITNSSNIIDNGALIYNISGTPVPYAGAITGSGSLTKAGAGNQTLSGNESYSGATTVNAGTLTLGGSNSGATAITINNPGTLAITNSNALLGASSLVVNNGTLNLAFGGTNHVITIAGNSGIALTLTSGALNFTIGTNVADELVFGNGSASLTGTSTITATALGTIALNSPTALIYDPLGGLVAADFIAPSLNNATFTTDVGGDTLYLSTGVTITTAYWKGADSGNWSDTNNFTSDAGGATPTVGGVTSSLNVIFSASGAQNQGATVLDTNISALSLTISDTNAVVIGGTNTLTLAGNAGITTGSAAGAATISVNVNLAGSAPVIAVGNTANALTIGGAISGSNGVTVQGPGLLILAGTNTYTGGTTLTGGTTQITNVNSLGSLSGGITFSGINNSALQLAPSLGNFSMARSILVQSTGTAAINANGNNLTISGIISGGGPLNIMGGATGGAVILTATNTYTGALAVTSGTLQVGNGVAGSVPTLGSPSSITVTGALAFNLAGTQAFSSTVSGAGTIVQNGSSWLQITGNNNVSNYLVNSGTMSIEAGATMFGGSTTPTGSITVNSGATFLVDKGDFIGGNSAASPNVTVTLNGGAWVQNASIANIGTLNLVNGGIMTTENGFSSAFPSISIRGPVITVSGSGESIIQTTNQGNTVFNVRLSGSNNSTSDITTFNVGKTTASGPDLLVQANIEDGWAYNTQNLAATTLVKTGSGTMSLTGSANAWSGGTQINGGILSLGSAGALPTTAYNTANSGNLSASGTVGAISFGGGTLQFTASNTTDYSANFSAAANQGFSFDTNGQNVTLASGLVSSSGSLTVVDSHAASHGTLTLAGTSTYNGATVIGSGATLQLGDGTTGHDGTIAGTSGVTDNGALIYNRIGSTSAGYAIAGTGAVTVMGSGTQTLIGTSSYTGATAVTGGTLIVSGSLTGTVSASVAAGATLELDGSLNNAATVTVAGALQGTGFTGGITANGGALTAGLTAANSQSSTGILTAAGAVTLSGSTNFNIRLGMLAGGTDSDLLEVAGNNTVSLNGANLQLTLGANFSDISGAVYNIIDDPNAAVSGTFSEGSSITAGGYLFNILYDENAAGTGSGDDVDLVVAPIPEPGTWATFAFGTLLLLRIQTRRRRREQE